MCDQLLTLEGARNDLEQGIAIISIIISFISIGVTLYNSFKQREIDEKLQKNEFEYSRRDRKSVV